MLALGLRALKGEIYRRTKNMEIYTSTESLWAIQWVWITFKAYNLSVKVKLGWKHHPLLGADLPRTAGVTVCGSDVTSGSSWPVSHFRVRCIMPGKMHWLERKPQLVCYFLFKNEWWYYIVCNLILIISMLTCEVCQVGDVRKRGK